MLRENILLITTILLAIGLRCLLWFWLGIGTSKGTELTTLVGDANHYHLLAKCLVDNGTLTETGVLQGGLMEIDTSRAPGYPVFLALIYLIFGTTPEVAVLFQLMIGFISAYLIYMLGRTMFNTSIGKLCGVSFLFEPHHLIYSYSLLSETLFVLVLLATVLWFYRLIRTPRQFKYLILTIVGSSALAYLRPIGEFLPFFFGIILLTIGVIQRQSVLRKSMMSIGLVIGFYALMAPWMIRNYKLYERYDTSSIKGYNLMTYNVAKVISAETGKEFYSMRAKLLDNLITIKETYRLNSFDMSTIGKNVSMSFIKSNPSVYTKTHLNGMKNMYTALGHKGISRKLGLPYSQTNEAFGSASLKRFTDSGLTPENLIALVILFFHGIVYLLAALSLPLVIKKKLWIYIGTAWAIILYFTFLTGPVGLDRYKVPIMPFLILLAGAGGSLIRSTMGGMRNKRVNMY